jgi:1A family penicillin-binding protein
MSEFFRKWLGWVTPRRVLMSALVLAGVVAASLGVGVAAILAGVGGNDCPTIADLQAYRPPEATRVFAGDGSIVADLSPQRRVVLEPGEIPALVRDAAVAVEDRRFWEHRGVDLRSVVRASWRNLRGLSVREGFSTIPMQLARSVFPEQLPMSRKGGRKVCEIQLALQIERTFPKDQILAMYLNQIYLGSGLYGVEAAAQGYFGIPASKLDAAQAALLIGLAKSPNGFNPRRHPERAKARRDVVLGVMAGRGVVDAATASQLRSTPIRLAPPAEASGPAPYFVAAVRKELQERFGPEADILGLRVFTGLDPALQRASHEALVHQISRIERGELGRYPHAAGGNGDPATPVLQGMVVVLDPKTGEVRALVGGRDFATSQFDRAFQARRQPGSAFKPIVYAAALEAGLATSSRLETSPVVVETAGSPVWRPGDHVADTVESLTLRTALAVSSNHAAVRLGQWVGEARVAGMGRRLGLTTSIPEYPSIHLGSAEVIPAELVAAFAVFGNGGYQVTPTLIQQVEDIHGTVLWRAQPPRHQVLDPGVAFLTLTMLEEAVNAGTAASVRANGFWQPAAGKTGTTNEAKDVWFVGLTPDLVAGVWLGFDQPRRIMAGASGGRLAAPVWAAVMTQAYRNRPSPAPWTPPSNVVSVELDARTGHLAGPNCPEEDIRLEYFLAGTEPRTYCPVHGGPGVERLFESLWQRMRRIF